MENIIIYSFAIVSISLIMIFIVCFYIYAKAIIYTKKQYSYEKKSKRAVWDNKLLDFRKYSDLADSYYFKAKKWISMLNFLIKYSPFCTKNDYIPQDTRLNISNKIKVGKIYKYPDKYGRLAEGRLHEIIPCGSITFMLMQDKNIHSKFDVTNCIFYK